MRSELKIKKFKQTNMMMLVFSLCVLMLGILAMNSRAALDMTENHGKMMHAVMEIKHNSTRFHLWIEELLSGDSTFSKRDVWVYMDSAQEYAQALLKGGDTEIGYVNAADYPKLHAHVKKTLSLLERLNELGELRFNNGGKGGAESPIDAVFDQFYVELQEQAEITQSELLHAIGTEKREYINMAFLLGVIVFLATVVYAYIFNNYERRQLKHTLRIESAETRIRSVLNTVAEGVVTTDHLGFIESLNPAAENLFGYNAGEAVNRHINMLFPVLSDDLLEVGGDELRAQEMLTKVGLTLELDGNHRDGSVFPTEVKINEMQLEGDQYFTMSIRDITERKQAEDINDEYNSQLEEMVEIRTVELSEALIFAEQASDAKSEFLSRMSHELRTPMNAILGFGQVLELDSKDLNEIQRSNINEINQAGHHLLDLINEVLDLAKIESGELDISMQTVSVSELMRQCLPLIASQAEARQLEFLDKISSKNYFVQADQIRLKQVLLNLFSNAVKYNSEQGQIVVDSEIVSELDDIRRLRIKVSDTGTGLTKEDINKLFVPFERLNIMENVEGTGIGLVICKHLIESMGGRIGVDSIYGEGSTFWFELALLDET